MSMPWSNKGLLSLLVASGVFWGAVQASAGESAELKNWLQDQQKRSQLEAQERRRAEDDQRRRMDEFQEQARRAHEDNMKNQALMADIQRRQDEDEARSRQVIKEMDERNQQPLEQGAAAISPPGAQGVAK